MLAIRRQLLTPAVARRVFARPTLLTPSARRFVASTGLPGSQRVPPHEARRRLLLLAVPLLGASALVLRYYQRDDASVTALLSSERVLPLTERNYPLSSPAEERRTPFSRLWNFIRQRILEPILVSGRFLHLLALFLPVIASAPALLFGHVDPECGERAGALWWYNFLVTQMERAGPTFIKLAQWAGSRADLFPPRLCDRFSNLHSSGKVHSFAHTKRVIERVFERPFDEVFEEFDKTPIGSGAIAQVYRATLRPDLIPPGYLDPKRMPNAERAMLLEAPGPESVPTASVAIKILHPHVSNMIARDLTIMRLFARAISLIPGAEWLSLPEEVDVFGTMMSEQLDLRNEVQNLLRFEANFSKRHTPITFPRPLSQFSSHDVLVEEFAHALPLNHFLKNGGGPFDETIAELGLDGFLHMLLIDNFVHADAHPGNLLIKFYKPSTSDLLKSIIAKIFRTPSSEDTFSTPDADAKVDTLAALANTPAAWKEELQRLHDEGWQPEIVFLDAGLITTLNVSNRKNFIDLFRAIAEFDGYRAGKLMVERCRTPEMVIDAETFALKIQNLVLNVKSQTFSLARIRISDVLTNVLKHVRQHHVKLEPDFVNTVVSCLLLEGIGRRLDPSLDLFKSSLPILRQLGRHVTAKDALEHTADIGSMLKIWIWVETRELASSAIVDADDLIHGDWLSPNV